MLCVREMTLGCKQVVAATGVCIEGHSEHDQCGEERESNPDPLSEELLRHDQEVRNLHYFRQRHHQLKLMWPASDYVGTTGGVKLRVVVVGFENWRHTPRFGLTY